jgi:histidyl-tRNA synthetase
VATRPPAYDERRGRLSGDGRVDRACSSAVRHLVDGRRATFVGFRERPVSLAGPFGRAREAAVRREAEVRRVNKIAAPRGTADIYPPESARWQALESSIHQIARRFGYGEIRTPTFESTELFVRGVGETTDIVEKEMYTFLDKGDRSMTLRPEWTAPVVRAVLEHQLLAQGPVRLYYIGPMYRYERPQAGRYRQAHQFGVECFGFAGPEADVETIALAHEVMRANGLEVTVSINSIGDAVCRPRYRDALFAHFAPHRDALSADSQRRLDRNPLRILDSKAPEDRTFVETAPAMLDVLCDACAEHFARVRALLDASAIAYRVDRRIVRGLDYYTRTVFEFISEDLGAQATVCAGGRYDGLVAELGGPPTPGVGFALGMERFLMILAKRDTGAPATRQGIALVALGEAARMRVVPLVAALRRASGDLPVTIDYGDGKIAAHFKKADRAGARAAVIVGDDELQTRTIVVRDLATRAQESLAASGSDGDVASAVLAWYGALPVVAEAAA